MADTKEGTEEPTPKRLAEARRRGDVARSRDLDAAAGLIAFVGLAAIGGGSWWLGLGGYMRSGLSAGVVEAGGGAAVALAWRALALALVAPLAALALAAVLSGVAQTRGLWASEAIGFDPRRVMPSLAHVWSVAAVVQAAKGLAVVVVLSTVVAVTFEDRLAAWTRLPGAPPARIAVALAEGAAVLGLRLAVVAACLGIVDYLWQWLRHRRSMLMTREETKREHKESEGDPHHKGERQRLHRELLEQRMIDDVRRADFVVVNPDHIAVAIRYERDLDEAPVVVAKGERLLAERIKEVAREAGVPIFRDVALARSLRDVEEGDPIPEVLYEAVAEILRVVYGAPPAGGDARDDRRGEPASHGPTPGRTPGPPSSWRRA